MVVTMICCCTYIVFLLTEEHNDLRNRIHVRRVIRELIVSQRKMQNSLQHNIYLLYKVEIFVLPTCITLSSNVQVSIFVLRKSRHPFFQENQSISGCVENKNGHELKNSAKQISLNFYIVC